MTIEEIEKACGDTTDTEWSIFIDRCESDDRVYLSGPQLFTDNRMALRDARFICLAKIYMIKLIAIAKAAKSHIESCEDAGITDGLLQEAIKELEK